MDEITYSITDRLDDLKQQLIDERNKLQKIKKIDKYSHSEYQARVATITNRIFELEEQFAFVSKLKWQYYHEIEFEKRKRIHKYVTIVTALLLFEQKGIYKHRLLIQKYGTMDRCGDERAFYVADQLQNGDPKIYDKVYEMCWKKVCNRIPDTIAFNTDNLF